MIPTLSSTAIRAAHATASLALPRGTTRPLSLLVTLRRNPLRTIPMFLAILAASFGIATIVLFAHSVLRTGVASNDFLMGTLLVRSNGASVSELARYVGEQPQSAAVYRTNLQFVRGRVLDMTVWFPVQLASNADVAALVRAYGDRLVDGRLPERALDVVIPVAFGKSRGVGVGDELGGASDLTPLRLTVVGLIDGPRRVILGSNEGLTTKDLSESVLVFPRSEEDKDRLEAALAERFGASANVRDWMLGSIDDPTWGADVDETQYRGDLQLILWFIVTINAAVLAGIGGLLSFIYFRQRRPEFVLLSLLGRSRRTLFARVIMELAVIAGAAWSAGLALGYAFSGYLGETVLRSRGITMDLDDGDPALYTLPLVALIVLVSAGVTVWGFVRFDPVSDMEVRA